MKSSLNSGKKSISKISKKIIVFLLVFVMLFSFLAIPPKPANAQLLVTDTLATAWAAGTNIWQKITNTLKLLLLKGGAMAFQQVLRTALNKIAYDTANYLGSGDKGQKPLFITQNWGDYLTQIADEAGGQFIESFAANLSAPISSECQAQYQECMKPCLATPDLSVSQTGPDPVQIDGFCDVQACKQAASNCDLRTSTGVAGVAKSNNASGAISDFNQPSFNVCQPSSLEAKVKIGLGLVEQQRPGAPNCTATKMIQNWGDEAQKLTDWKDPEFISKFTNIFNPASNDLGIYLSARTDMINKQVVVDQNTKLNLTANKGWQDKTNIAKKAIGVPGDAERKADTAEQGVMEQIGRTTGDILIDAANVFLNQYAISKFNDLMSQLGKKASQAGEDTPEAITRSNTDVTIFYGEGSLKEVTSEIIEPDFGVRADYDILSQLVICPDPKNPGPTNCAIDDKLMQGITEKRTVAEAIKDGYIHGDWQLSKDTVENTYSLRNISILRKYRILPIGWEEAIIRANASSTKVTVMDLVSCFDTADSYNQFTSDFNVRDQAWCRGLVDPNWVLKAPLNYCRKQGSSAQIMSGMVIPSIPGVNGNPYAPSTWNITRAEDYCADEQTCIKEKDDGSCEVYGYCNEEKRTWKFTGNTCDPIYNTCKKFTNSISGKSVSYLENTLNYTNCSPESAGCRQYSVFGTYATSTGVVSWDGGKSFYFNKYIGACNGKDEGCTELLRIKPTWGANLVMDADFYNELLGASSTGAALLGAWPYWSSNNTNNNSRVATIVDSSLEPGGAIGRALKLEVSRSAGGQIVLATGSDSTNSLLPENFQLISGQSYTLSADVYLAEGSNAHVYLGKSEDGFVNSTNVLGSWQHLSVTRMASGAFSEPEFGINADNNAAGNIKFYVKNVKFEVSDFATGFNIYGAYKIYEKLIPPYLEKSCYVDAVSATKDYQLRSDAPAECLKFARKCNRNEVGCELFTGVKNGLGVTAQVTSADYCPGECLGYNVYISKQDHFNSAQAENIIPKTAKTCTVEAVGCNEFTNLDELAQGGENKEYYSFLKQCIKPSSSCASFYSWEGTESGYQLRAYSLKKAENGSGEPAVTEDDSTLCTAEIYNKPLGDPLYNADCREFYNSAGAVSYHLISRTITCADNCHAYRMSEKNIDKTLTQAQCNAITPPKSYWDASIGSCYVCINGGAWDNELKACVYQAIPKEGKTCQASENGCREYNGNDGNNVRVLGYYDFESGMQGWNSNCNGGGNLASAALQWTTISNNKNGHSLLYNDGALNCAVNIGEGSIAKTPLIKKVFASANEAAQLPVDKLVTQGKSYSLRFIAKATSDTVPQIYFYNNNTADPQKAYFATSTLVIRGGGEWSIYQTNLENLDHKVSANEVLIITASSDFYFDDVVLTEITDRYYLIKNSSEIPDICYYDIFDNYQGADYNLGCAQYLDRSNLKHNLHKFSKLCSNSAVGCEQMISTQNYTPYGAGIWNDTNDNKVCDGDEPDCVTVSGDQALYAVYDSSKQCNSADIGCSRLGQGVSGSNAWSDVYKRNNPNLYDKTLCGPGEVGCEEWRASDNTLNYFRDPGNETCQYRTSQDPTIIGKAWYKIPVKRCDSNSNAKIEGAEQTGKVCNSVNDCAGKPCIIDTNEYLCTYSFFETFGLGGAGNQIPVPDQQAGLCEAKASGCTEYVDPVSRFSPNLVYNPSFEISNNQVAGWGPSENEKWNNNNISDNQQIVKLDPNKLYIFSTKGNSSVDVTSLNFLTGVKELLANNNLGTSTVNISIPAATDQNIIFASLNNSRVLLTGGDSSKLIEVKVAITNYQLQENIDRASCNGVANFDNGCVLFNERTVNGASGLVDLSDKWDAQATEDKHAPVNCDKNINGSCTANQLIKVRPDRTCAKWLDCLTYVKDPKTEERTCYAVGECTRLDDKNECISFEDGQSGTIKFSSTGQNKNATGYYLLDKYHLSNMQEVGLNSEAHYDFEDNVPALSCARASGGGTCAFNKNIVTDLLIREPEKASTETGYPAHGTTYLKVPSSYLISPQSKSSWISLISGETYYINFLVNTKGSGVGAKLMIDTKANTSLLNKVYTANNGWERKIDTFTVIGNGDSKLIRITLGASDANKEGSVYFDDINIEPVLEVSSSTSSKSYVSRECRLYPTNDSLTCVNKSNNVLRDGWEGYCLEHDPNNKDVCLMWYPVDQISAAKTTRNVLGYQGKFPLSYCTELNGNFDLVEKRFPKLVGMSTCQGAGWYTGCGEDDENCAAQEGKRCYYGIESEEMGAWANSTCTARALNPNLIKNFCGSKAVGNYWLEITAHGNFTPNERGYYTATCMPAYLDPTANNRGAFLVKEGPELTIPSKACPPDNNEEDFIYAEIVGPTWEGWFKYNGLDTNNDAGFSGMGELLDPSQGATTYRFDEAKNATPPIRVYDYTYEPADEDGLKLIASKDIDQVFRLTCNRFAQVVDNNGDNKAWASRTGINSAYPTSTPAFFIDYVTGLKFYGAVDHQINAYGRNREDVPFGAAVWPDSFSILNSEPIKFRNQYSKKNSEEVFAGRPYGCNNGSKGSGCANVGYCSIDPSVYCVLTDNSDFNKKACADGSYGTCVPIWTSSLETNLPAKYDFMAILKTIFLKTYSSYYFDGTSYTSDILGPYDYVNNIINEIPNCLNRPVDSYSAAPTQASFCAVLPTIEAASVVIKYGNKKITENPFNIPKKGIYSLEFNTTINPEQQPLKEIYIDWGDGNKQVITGQDSHPDPTNPHVFYHYYKSSGPKPIMINIKDNWGAVGLYGECARGNICLEPVY